MKVLSLFDGISCARVALKRAGIKVDRYYASEIDKYAMQISDKNYPDIVHIGDVRDIYCKETYIDWKYGYFPKDIDLLIGGSPCQDLSVAKRNRKGLDGERSGLFWEYARILREVKPRWFILENVASMPKDAMATITKELGVEPIMINASLVSAQNRKRLFWTNIPGITQPKDRGILLKDILQSLPQKELEKYLVSVSRLTKLDYYKKTSGWTINIGNINPSGKGMNGNVYHEDGKSPTLTTNKGEGVKIFQISRGFNKGGMHYDKSPTLSANSRQQNNLLEHNGVVRRMTPIECERLQGLPDNYTEGVSNTQRYKMLGNAFNVDVVAHILSFIILSNTDESSGSDK